MFALLYLLAFLDQAWPIFGGLSQFLLPAADFFLIVAGFFGLCIMMYTGIMLSTLKAHAFWATPALPVLFTISAISTGCAAIVLSIGGWPAQITLESLLAAALVMVPYCVLTGERFTAETFQPVSLACLLVLGMFHTGFAYALYFGSMKALRAQTIAIFSYIDPVIAILLSVTVLHEPFSILSAVGSVLILGAAFVSEKT